MTVMTYLQVPQLQAKLSSYGGVINQLADHDRIWIGGAGGIVYPFIERLVEEKERFNGLSLSGLLFFKPSKLLEEECKGHISYNCLFAGPLERTANANGGNVELTSVSFSYYPQLLDETINANWVVVPVSEPNEQGKVSLGHIGSIGHAQFVAKDINRVFVINKNIPFCDGEGMVYDLDHATHIIADHYEVPVASAKKPGEFEMALASHVVPLINDGDTIQLGIGALPDALGYSLGDKKDLGIHTEIFTDSMMHLMKSGVVTNKRKNIHPGKSVFGGAIGSQELNDFLHNNDDLMVKPIHEVTTPLAIAAHDNFVSINTCIMSDLTGQVASEGVGNRQISGTGGQLDFVRGANLSKGVNPF